MEFIFIGPILWWWGVGGYLESSQFDGIEFLSREITPRYHTSRYGTLKPLGTDIKTYLHPSENSRPSNSINLLSPYTFRIISMQSSIFFYKIMLTVTCWYRENAHHLSKTDTYICVYIKHIHTYILNMKH